MKKSMLALCLLCTTVVSARFMYPYKAVITVPVADLIGKPTCTVAAAVQCGSLYKTMPISPKNMNSTCPRLHQALFNEVVTVLDEQGDEAKVAFSPVYFLSRDDDKKQHEYWTLKKNLTPLETLRKAGIHLNAIPPPVQFSTPNSVNAPEVVSLIQPFTDPTTHVTYSAGTRFVTSGHRDEQCPTVTVKFYDPFVKSVRTLQLPTKLIVQTTATTQQGRIANFVSIIRSWAHQLHGFIPYVWGGCSFTKVCHLERFIEYKHPVAKEPCFRRLELQGSTQTGLDCSGLIARATQMAGIPYFYKNSATIERNLDQLKPHETIENGDIIWFPGHVLVVSDVQQQLIVEARGYEHDYGKVVETPLAEQFKGIHTFAQLKKAFLEGKPLLRLDRHGKVVKTLGSYKILKLASVWRKTASNIPTPPKYTNHTMPKKSGIVVANKQR